MIDDLTTWRTTFQALAKVATSSWAANFAAWTAGRVVDAELDDINDSTPPTFVFAESVFKTQLESLVITDSYLTAATQFANAWETAILASSIDVEAGSSVGTSSPATTWSVVASSIIFPSSILAGKARIMDIQTAALVSSQYDSEFCVIFRDAFLLLQGKIDGLNSVPTPVALTATKFLI